jgi:hypothetical protein
LGYQKLNKNVFFGSMSLSGRVCHQIIFCSDVSACWWWGRHNVVSEQKNNDKVVWVALPEQGLVAGDVTKWYQSHGFNTEPGWAMLVEVEAKFWKRIVVEMDKIQVQSPWFQH